MNNEYKSLVEAAAHVRNVRAHTESSLISEEIENACECLVNAARLHVSKARFELDSSKRYLEIYVEGAK